MTKALEQINIRCRQLGHSVPLSYCMKMNDKHPCLSTIKCWQEKIPIAKFLEKCYTKKELEKIFSVDNKQKIEKLIDMVNDSDKS